MRWVSNGGRITRRLRTSEAFLRHYIPLSGVVWGKPTQSWGGVIMANTNWGIVVVFGGLLSAGCSQAADPSEGTQSVGNDPTSADETAYCQSNAGSCRATGCTCSTGYSEPNTHCASGAWCCYA